MSNEATLREFMEQVWNNKQTEHLDRYLNAEYTIRLDTADPWEGKTLNHDKFRERLNHSFQPFPDIHFAIQDAVADENQVAITWIMTGTNLGNIGEIAATGKPIKTTGMTIYHFHEGKISGHSQVFDRMTVFQQLGFLSR